MNLWSFIKVFSTFLFLLYNSQACKKNWPISLPYKARLDLFQKLGTLWEDRMKRGKPEKNLDGNPLRPVNRKSAVLFKPRSPFWRGRVKKFYYSMYPCRFYSLLYIETVYINTLNIQTLHNSSATIFNLKCTHRNGVDYCMSYADFFLKVAEHIEPTGMDYLVEYGYRNLHKYLLRGVRGWIIVNV